VKVYKKNELYVKFVKILQDKSRVSSVLRLN